ncbi:MAG: MarR family transcriptional regulator [Bacteroidetes bacterium]|nr:MarR family transcriptional regulator [Bacteroidota bacterium]
MKTAKALQMSSFSSEQQRVVLTVLHTASNLMSLHRTLLKPHGITPGQFNILRILRGQKGKPIALRDITSRMIDPNSNTSRLVDKLLTKGLLERTSCPDDRRRIDIVLTSEGERTICHLSGLMEASLSSLEAVWAPNEAAQVSDLLDRWNETQNL